MKTFVALAGTKVATPDKDAEIERLRADRETYNSWAAEIKIGVDALRAENERLRAYIWTLDGKTVCTRIDGNNFIDEGIIVASDIAPLGDQQSAATKQEG